MKTLLAALRASNGQLLTVTQTNAVMATSATPGPSEFFTLIYVEAGKLALKSSRGFVCLKGESAALVVGTGDIAQAEVFTQVDRPDGTIGLLAGNAPLTVYSQDDPDFPASIGNVVDAPSRPPLSATSSPTVSRP